jgi:flavin-binding protein dodecin
MPPPFGLAPGRCLGNPGHPANAQKTVQENDNMAMLKVIEVLAESDKSWDDAAANAVSQASKTVRNIESIYVENMKALVSDNKIVKYRINAKITFRLD